MKPTVSPTNSDKPSWQPTQEPPTLNPTSPTSAPTLNKNYSYVLFTSYFVEYDINVISSSKNNYLTDNKNKNKNKDEDKNRNTKIHDNKRFDSNKYENDNTNEKTNNREDSLNYYTERAFPSLSNINLVRDDVYFIELAFHR